MGALDSFLSTERASPAEVTSRLFDSAYESGKETIKGYRDAVVEHPWLTAGAVAAAVGLFVITRGRASTALTEGLVARSGAGAVESGAAAAIRMSEPTLAGAARLAAPEARGAALEMLEVPIMKGPWSESMVSRVTLPADHWVSRAYLNSKDAVVQVIRDGERQGTGFFVDKGGLVVTNHHVVGVPKLSYQIGLSDGSCYSARVVSIDPTADLAVLKILKPGAREFKALEIGTSTTRSAHDVVALGFPEEVRGVVASPGSYLKHESIVARSGIQRRVEFDMVMKRGNSGSPVIGTDGRVSAVLNRYSFGDQAYGPSAEHLKALIEATRRTEIGAKYLVVDTSLPVARRSLFERIFRTAGDATVGHGEATLSQPFAVEVRKAVLTSRPPISA